MHCTIGPFEGSAHVCPGYCTSEEVCRPFVPPQLGSCSRTQMAKLDHFTFTFQAISTISISTLVTYNKYIGGWEGVMLCRVEEKSEQMSLESFAENGE